MDNKLVIFDMDGLIFDTEKLTMKAWTKAANEFGYDFNFDLFCELIGKNKKQSEKILNEKLGEDFIYSKLSERGEALVLEALNTAGILVKEGVYELLDFLKEKGIKTALASSSSFDRIYFLLEKYEIKNYFHCIVSGDEVEISKPNPEIFLKTAKQMNVEPKNCIVFEDSEAGIEAAYYAGMVPVIVPDIKEPSEETKNRAYKNIVSLKKAQEIIIDLFSL